MKTVVLFGAGQIGAMVARLIGTGYAVTCFADNSEKTWGTTLAGIPVVSPEGEVAYTRDGAFKQGKDGYLVTSDGWLVGDGIKIPSNCYNFSIKENGEVVTKDSIDGVEKKIGTIPLVRFDNPEGLKSADMNRLVPTDLSGNPKLVKNPNCFRQSNVEISNVNMYESLNDILRVNASLLASTKMMKVADDMYNRAINIRQG